MRGRLRDDSEGGTGRVHGGQGAATTEGRRRRRRARLPTGRRGRRAEAADPLQRAAGGLHGRRLLLDEPAGAGKGGHPRSGRAHADAEADRRRPERRVTRRENPWSALRRGAILRAVTNPHTINRNTPDTTAPTHGAGTLSVGDGDEELDRRLDAELTAFNTRATGIPVTELTVRITDADGELLGGLSGWNWGRCGGIEMLWVREDTRGQGVGARLIAAAEEEARARGCEQMIVSSFTFQAPPFYAGLGYRETGRIEGLPGGHADVSFVKEL
ncbi:GNAT family N-acetyltransferase [Streptomyces sp. OF3]|uniref:GNAT family N-acetyltransferase n=1 Tax=Streptomyces alkaliterrae TaxID=2213162 RepID=A0A7W3WMV3_9ACTN|nr:GNAT family N-acetyltransferase [Streptomyces alkaliterrae]